MAILDIPSRNEWTEQQLDLHDQNLPVWHALHDHSAQHVLTVKRMREAGLTHEQACRLLFNQAASWLRNA